MLSLIALVWRAGAIRMYWLAPLSLVQFNSDCCLIAELTSCAGFGISWA